MAFAGFIVGLLLLYPVWLICRRAGFNPLLALLVLVPAVGPLAVLVILAMCDWPRARAAGPPGPGGGSV